MPLLLHKILSVLVWSLLSALLAALVLAWTIVGTPAGTQWLAERVAAMAGDTLAWQALDGTALGHLQMRGLRVQLDSLTLDADTLTLNWQPGRLLTGTVQVEHLAASGIRVALRDTAERAAPAQPFSPNALDLPVDVVVDAVTLRDLTLHFADRSPVQVQRIALSAALADHRLSLRTLEVQAPDGGLQGRGHIELTEAMPLAAQLSWHWRLPDTRQLGGELQLTGDAASTEIEHRGAGDLPVNLHGALHALLGQPSWELTVDWPQLPLTSADSSLLLGPGTLATRGDMTAFALEGEGLLTAPDLQPLNWSLVAHNSDRNLQLAALQLTTGPYALALQGALDWGGPLALALRYRATAGELGRWNPELPEQLTAQGALAARFEQETFTIERLDLALLQSALRAQLQGVAHLPAGGEPVLDMALQWHALTWPLHAGAPVISPEGELSVAGSVGDWKLNLAARAMDRDLAATVHGAVTDATLSLQPATLAYGENRLSASGQLAATRLDLDWTLQLPDPGALLPGVTGALQASGRLAGSAASPRLRARLDGQQLQVQDFQLSHLEATLQAGLAAQDPLRLAVSLGPLRQGQQRLLDTARLDIAGTTARHEVALALEGASDSLQARLAGGLNTAPPVWRGRIDALTVDSAGLGAWRLGAAPALSLAADRLTLEETCLWGYGVSGAGLPGAGLPGADHPEIAPPQEAAAVCVGGHWNAASGAGLAARLEALPVERFLPQVGGRLRGQLQASLPADGSLRGQGKLHISPGQIELAGPAGREQLAHGGGELQLALGADGLDATLSLEPVTDGVLQARLQLPQFSRWPLPQPQPLAGHISAELADLHGLQGWVPALDAIAGRLSADLRLAGSLAQPQVLGEIALADGAADVPRAGLHVRQLELQVRDHPQRSGELLLSGAARVGRGRLAVDGWLDPAAVRASVSLAGDKLDVFDTPDARVQVSPNLQIDWADQGLKLRGRVRIPRADITPQLGLRPGAANTDAEGAMTGAPAIRPSSDVVVIGTAGELRDSQPPGLPFRLDSEVEVALGDAVRVSALGFNGRITGGLTLTHPPQQRNLIPRGTGRLSVEGGTFRAFGQDLDIETGEVLFRDELVTQPEVNLRAVRWIDRDPLVSAVGVQVTGPADAPSLELFSRPQLDPTEIQSYLLTGHSAAGGDSVLSLGTYLHPKLYVGYGYNLLEETSEFDTLYTITPRYGIEASVGEADNAIGVTFSYEH